MTSAASFVVAIAGPTGVGKSALAVDLATRSGGEIVNYDSIQLYRGFDIGSAKPSAEEQARAVHHLIDLIEPAEDFNVADFVRVADKVCAEIERRGQLPILAGGTGFYLRAFLQGLPELPGRDAAIRSRIERLWEHPRSRVRLAKLLAAVDPISASRLAPADRQRRERALEVWFASGRPISSWEPPRPGTTPRHEHLLVILHLPRTELIRRLDQRVIAMYEAGLIEETAALLSRYPAAARPFQAIGYAEAVRFLNDEISRDEAIRDTQKRTRAYAKRQMTWLRSEVNALWISAEAATPAISDLILEHLNRRRSPP